jgi:AraC-like DNA-binding protein
MFHFDKNFGLFIGKLNENKFHKHYAFQISVSLESNMMFSTKDDNEFIEKSFFINSNVEHRLISEAYQLTILINPLSSIGHQLYLKYGKTDFSILNNTLSNELTEILNSFLNVEITFLELCSLISQTLFNYQCFCELEGHLGDNRIVKALKYMDDNFDKVLSLEDISGICFLSPTRFLHLFKEQTNLTFRRYKLWNKLVKSLPYLLNNSIIDTAYSFGFSDSSHYIRTFKETFGVTPKFLIPKQ